MARGAPDYAISRIGARAFLGFDALAEVNATDVGGGIVPVILHGGPVPANKVWHITNAIARNLDGPTPQIYIQAATAWGTYSVVSEPNVPQNQGVYLQGDIWLEAGDEIRAAFIIPALGDNVYLAAQGTEIDVEV